MTHPDLDKVDRDHPEYGIPQERVEWRSFVNSEGDHDDDGHGTHSAALLLKLAPKAKIFVARVVEGRSGTVDAATVAQVRGLPYVFFQACGDLQ